MQSPSWTLLSSSSMRYLLDTNVYIFYITDSDRLSRDVRAILEDPDNTFYLSVESVRELIVLFRKKRYLLNFWKTAEEMVDDIETKRFIQILPLKKEHLETYARLEINEDQEHNDPSDHIIISHAITERIPLISSDTRFPFYTKQGLDLIYNC